MKKIYFVYVTFGSLKEAKKLGSLLVKKKLAACTNIIPTIIVNQEEMSINYILNLIELNNNGEINILEIEVE